MLHDVTDNPFDGLADADELAIKQQAVEIIEAEMKVRGMTQDALAKADELKQPHISEILHRKLNRFSIDRLNQVLAVFGRKVGRVYRIEAA